MAKILVTGADGFIGSHLVESLIDDGHDVRAFCFYNSFNSLGWIEDLPPEKIKVMEAFSGDIRDEHRVRSAMRGVDIVFHLAALIAIPFSYASPQSYAETNILGTLNVLQAARDEGVKKILVTSTSEVYGTAKYIPIDEKHSRQGQSPYSASKIGADALAESFYRSYGLPVIIVRPFNTYGPRQSARAIIPAIIIQLLSGQTKIRLGALHPTRDLVFVQDTIQGFKAIAQCETLIGEEVNIATSLEIGVGDLAQKLIAAINPDARIELDPSRLRPAPSEVERLLGSSDKIRKATGWRPQISLEMGLAKTLEWFRNPKNIAKYKSEIYNQ
jgi:NAD dependent epimerase/dehydratase